MRRKGRQHGMVRTNRILPSPWNPKLESRFVQQLDLPLTAGLFTKVSKKPTNHSKFTGRCGKPRCLGCHMYPTCKAKNKTKGSHKLRSSDMTTNYKLITCRVVHGRPGLKFSGFSVTSILDYLSNDYEDYYKGNDDHDNDDGLKVNSLSLKEIENDFTHNTKENIVDDDDNDVKFVLDQDGEEEGWYMVGDI